MSRAFDLLLVALVCFLAWKLVRADDHLVIAGGAGQPVTAKVRVTGEGPLDGLGLLIIPSQEMQGQGQGFGALGEGGGQDTTPHQLSPFYRDRTAQIIVPAVGSYSVRFGLQDQGPPPRRARDVMLELAPEAKAPPQIIEVAEDSIAKEILIDLPDAHAAGLQALRKAE